MQNYDHYAEAKNIAEQLEKQGFGNEATAIREAIDYGTSGTEIFMQLKASLVPLLKNPEVAADTRTLMSVLVARLSAALLP